MKLLATVLMGVATLCYAGGTLLGFGTIGWGVFQLIEGSQHALEHIGLGFVIGFGLTILAKVADMVSGAILVNVAE